MRTDLSEGRIYPCVLSRFVWKDARGLYGVGSPRGFAFCALGATPTATGCSQGSAQGLKRDQIISRFFGLFSPLFRYVSYIQVKGGCRRLRRAVALASAGRSRPKYPVFHGAKERYGAIYHLSRG